MALPPVPGVPPLLRPPAPLAQLQGAVNTAVLLAADAQNLLRLFEAPRWGVFKDGQLVLQPDSVFAFAHRKEARISDYPQELGGFQQYNKVQMPSDTRVRLIKGGTEAERAVFLSAVEKAAESLDLFDVVTPERTYVGTNIIRMDYERTSTDGGGVLKIDLWLLEVRATASLQFGNARSVSGSGLRVTGTVQPGAASPRLFEAMFGGAR